MTPREWYKEIYNLGKNVTAPILLPYVQWIVSLCIEKKIKRIYFLARDGYILMKIAEVVCDKLDVKLDLRYLYCSRYSLRLPLYHILGNEGIAQITAKAYTNTPAVVFKRIGLSQQEMEEFMSKNNLDYPLDKVLDANEYIVFCNKLISSGTFYSMVNEKSLCALPATIGYLQQEGLFDNVDYAVVDSGWSGSMQRSLRQLLELSGVKKRLVGFYFGMYTIPESKEDGEYNTFCFNALSSCLFKAKFNNNLFECMLSADHGMTLGYYKTDEKYLPILKQEASEEELKYILAHHKGILAHIRKTHISNIFNYIKSIKKVTQSIQRVSYKPTVQEAKCYGKLMFSDDVSAENENKLASEEQIEQLKNYLLIKRAYRKLFKCRSGDPVVNLFWAYGTVAFVSRPVRWHYRMNILVWEFIRFILMNRRIKKYE